MFTDGARHERSIPLTGSMLHDLFNRLAVTLGHCDLLLMELPPDSPVRPSVTEIRDYCQRAVGLAEEWHRQLRADE